MKIPLLDKEFILQHHDHGFALKDQELKWERNAQFSVHFHKYFFEISIRGRRYRFYKEFQYFMCFPVLDPVLDPDQNPASELVSHPGRGVLAPKKHV